MNHYTNKVGFDAIRASTTWHFRAVQPPPQHHPVGAYFTTLRPRTRMLARRLRIPKSKVEFLFSFLDRGDLKPLRGSRGDYVYYSPYDYDVHPDRQIYSGRRDKA